MIGLDTNVVVRFLTQDDAAQAARVNDLFERQLSAHSPGYITLIVLVEVVWVLEACYQQTRSDIESLIHDLLITKQLVIEASDWVYLALKRFASGRADFSDALIAVVAENQGCSSVVTFDKKATSVGMRLLDC